MLQQLFLEQKRRLVAFACGWHGRVGSLWKAGLPVFFARAVADYLTADDIVAYRLGTHKWTAEMRGVVDEIPRLGIQSVLVGGGGQPFAKVGNRLYLTGNIDTATPGHQCGGTVVREYDPRTGEWHVAATLTKERHFPVTCPLYHRNRWYLFIGSGWVGDELVRVCELYDVDAWIPWRMTKLDESTEPITARQVGRCGEMVLGYIQRTIDPVTTTVCLVRIDVDTNKISGRVALQPRSAEKDRVCFYILGFLWVGNVLHVAYAMDHNRIREMVAWNIVTWHKEPATMDCQELLAREDCQPYIF